MIEKLQFSQILIVTRKKETFVTSKTITINQGEKKEKYSSGIIIPVFFEPFNQERRKIKWYPVCKV